MGGDSGWALYAHPLLLEQIDRLAAAVEKTRTTDPAGFQRTANAKLLSALRHLMFDQIPADPTLAVYRQGETLGPAGKHWFRAKFGNGRFRLFFRFDSRARIIVFAWVNDESTLRQYGARTDAYAVFRRRLDKGNPPDNWQALLKAATDEASLRRFVKVRDE